MFTQEISEPTTTILDDKMDVKRRLHDLATWQQDFQEQEFHLIERFNELESELEKVRDRRTIRMIERKQALIGTLRRRWRVLIVESPFEISNKVLDKTSIDRIIENAQSQYCGLTKEDKRLWLNNLYFLMTDDIRNLMNKLTHIRRCTEDGEQRNLLVGGESGSGKTRFLDFYAAHNMPAIEEERNRVNVVQVEAIKNDKTTKSLLQQIVLACGDNYVDDDSVTTLFNKIGRLLQKCDVRVVMIDELNHLSDETQRRRVLEISNKVVFTSIVGTAVNPLKFRENSPEIQGRFGDYYPIRAYIGDDLAGLLSFIEILLPFSAPSFLALSTIPIRDNKTITHASGPAAFIQEKTKGSFRYIMRLIKDAAETAISNDLSHISVELLQDTWANIQTVNPDGV